MNIYLVNYLSSISNYTVSLFKEKILPIVNDQQKRIILIATAALGFLAICYLMSRRCFCASDKTTPHHSPSVEEDDFDDILDDQEAKIFFPDRILREGEITNSQLKGQGKKIFPDGKTMTGNFENDELHGEAEEMILPNKTIYKGRFEHGQFVEGTITLPDRTVKKGTFEDDQLNGKGKITYPNGKVIRGFFQNDQLNGPGIIISPNGIWEGQFRNGKLHGKGQVIIQGIIYKGQFKQGELNGPGSISGFADGKIYEGNFIHNELHGPGRMIHPTGEIEEGVFNFGVFEKN